MLADRAAVPAAARHLATVVLVAAEFGRTAAANGTGGTDHGAGAAALLAGGAVRGGRVIADWPVLAAPALLDGRDPRPTTDLDDLIAGTVAGCFHVDPALVRRTLFPETRATKRLPDLVRA